MIDSWAGSCIDGNSIPQLCFLGATVQTLAPNGQHSYLDIFCTKGGSKDMPLIFIYVYVCMQIRKNGETV